MQTFIEFLSRGGRFGHYWFKESKRTQWWTTQTIPLPPETQENTYFGVHPSKVSKDPSQRTTIEDIQAINCLYADIDTKDYGNKQAAADHVKQLSPKPTIIIDSGGGYHCYWFLEEPFILDSLLKQEIARSLQERWVTFVGGDKAVHDLARILRVPGTFNYKYDPPRHVKILHSNLNRLYNPNTLEKYLPATDEHRGADDDQKAIPKAVRPNTLSLQEIVNLAQAAKGGEKFTALWRGWEEGYSSASEADLALCCLLAFWTGGDFKKIDKLFRLSDRMRDKWLDRPDYRHDTITQALGQVTDYYSDPGDYLTAGANDDGNAQCVASRMRQRFLFNSALGWRYFQGTHWDGELAESRVWTGITRVLKERRKAVWNGRNADLDEGIAKAISSAAKPSTRNISNCMRMLREMLTVSLREFDTSPDILNCRNGVIDLRTGKLTGHASSQRLTHCSPVKYLPDADRTVWTDWLLEAVGGRQEVVDYLQQAVGYTLTGHTREEILFYLYGPARAGKGIFTETLLTTLGGSPLAVEADIQMFMSKRGDPQGFMLAGLRTTRMLAASETRGRDWLDEAKLKNLTGGNLIRCAFKGKNLFQYRPQFKIWLSSNVLPKLDPDDTAAWLRLRVIEFPHSHIDDIDKKLKQHMKRTQVLEGVLAWAVEGAKQWYKAPKEGLKAPEVIRKGTEDARSALDQVEAWLRDRIIDTGAASDKLSYGEAFIDYSLYCDERGEKPRPRKHWKAALTKKGFNMEAQYGYKKPNGSKSTKRGWSGMKLQGGFRITIGDSDD
jgi:putative DNA primase/helicase